MLTEIKNVNLSYLKLAQRLLRIDKAMGMASMGVTEKLADFILNLTMEEAEILAASTQLLCRFGVNGHVILSAITNKGIAERMTSSTLTADAGCLPVDGKRELPPT
ncbi:flagellar transcriptional regulator FlhD [Paraburkholderia sp. FT54]|uniref:flagellar transcriptional regulator FlhD n=1 Tax=Paraburkholderia sp. FT54 TaxID=3074437 RepID=UPI002877BA72|nr:flagellar transcriptional regulator FlhD [Paraburkholderia sp. FT54]WNC93530.1 flagellar transcriptional regulator FlhD [Paraburkholderia sp. FT54]